MTKKANATLDLNSAEEAVLVQKLKIPARLAKRIIALRPYRAVDELNRVWGLDAEIYRRIAPLLSVEQPETAVPGEIAGLAAAVGPVGAAEPGAVLEPIQASSPEPGAPGVAWAEETFLVDESPLPDAGREDEPGKKPTVPWGVNALLVLILLVGAYFRLSGLNWDQNLHQQPDERFITMVVEQIRGVSGVAAYFDTATSTLNPLKLGSYTYGMLPLFFTRMAAEWVKMTSYDSIVQVGRMLSGLFDLAAVWMLYLLGTRLYDRRTALLAAGLSAAAVLSIQLSHYLAVDTFSTVFVVASFYFAILAVPILEPGQPVTRRNLVYFAIFGAMVGLAGACKVNTLPVFGIIVIAGVARLVSGWKRMRFPTLLKWILVGWALSALTAFLAFRIFQPYAFAGPGFFGVSLNQRWLDVISEVTKQVAGQSEWPPNHHWTARDLPYAWDNMVVWGMGLPLGLAAWLGWGWAAVRIWKGDWRRHLLPFAWVTSYFIWQNAQFWRYMRYFLPIYPLLILFAAWALLRLYDLTAHSRARLWEKRLAQTTRLAYFAATWKGAAGLLALGLVVLGTYLYAFGFTRIYTRPITRVSASAWMLRNIPGPLNLEVQTAAGPRLNPLTVKYQSVIGPGDQPQVDVRILDSGKVTALSSTRVSQMGVSIYFRISEDPAGEKVMTEGRLGIPDDSSQPTQLITFGDIQLAKGKTYTISYRIASSSRFTLADAYLGNDTPADPTIPLEWNFDNQEPGLVERSFSFQAGADYRLNRLQIGRFAQTFVPTQSTLTFSLYAADNDQKALAEATQTLNFSAPGMQLPLSLTFAEVPVSAGKSFRAKYGISAGGPVQFSASRYALETSWDDALPLSVEKMDPLGNIYSPLNLELYEPDTPEKRDRMLKILSESDYLVLPSNRAYDAMPRLPLRYPLTLKYYQTLFDCACSGDALENRAYGLRPPFKSPLGFELAAVFESGPSLGPWMINDMSADESFTVYDHPKVMIFKKSADFSAERVRAILNSVDLEKVIFQTPMDFTRAPTALQLTPDRLAAQLVGGTWSAMFNRLAFLNSNETAGTLVWYLFLLVLGWMVFPLLYPLFGGLPDRGYPLARMAGLLLTAWLAWISGSLKWLAFTRAGVGLCFGLVLAAGLLAGYVQRRKLQEDLRAHWKHFLAVEVIFQACFLYDLSVRLGNPDLWHPWLGGEKPMDFAFFNGVLKAVYFPPENPWFAGHSINYYYYGFVIAAIPTKLLGIMPSIAYNLILPAWFGMTGIGLFSVGYNLVKALGRGLDQAGSSIRQLVSSARWGQAWQAFSSHGLPYTAGIFSLVAVLFFGNFHMVRQLWSYLPNAPEEQLISPFDRAGAALSGAVQVLSGAAKLPGDPGRWYFEASRPILHSGPDTPIAEFPYFTFLYADLHPHLLVMPFYALALSWLLALLLLPHARRSWAGRVVSLLWAGLIFGSFYPTHTWDFPTFIGLGALLIAWDGWRMRGESIRMMLLTIVCYELAFVGGALLLYQPYREWFKSAYSSADLWKGLRTPLVDYFVVFGLSLFVMLSLLVSDLRRDVSAGVLRWRFSLRSRLSQKRYLPLYGGLLAGLAAAVVLWWADYQVLAFGLPLLGAVLYLGLRPRETAPLRRIAWLIYAAGLGVTLLVEVIVLKGDTGRANTVFRFYNQAWFLIGIAMTAALFELAAELRAWRAGPRTTWLVGLGLLLLGAVSYPLIATQQKMADRWPGIENPPHTLNGALYMLGEAQSPNGPTPAIYSDENRPFDLSKDYSAIQYMQDAVVGSPVIVEGNTSEYRWGSRFSIYTGLPSVVGWSWHTRQHAEVLDGALIEKQINEVAEFYNTTDTQVAQKFLTRYQVGYIIVGELERAYYAPEGLQKLRTMMDEGRLLLVFGDGTANTTSIYAVAGTR